MLSFTLVSHIGYMIFGIALATPAGYAGAIFYIAHHITIQTALFLVVGLVERRAGTHVARPARRARRASPRCSAMLFFVPAMNLAGHPAVVGLPRQGRAARRRARGRHPARVAARRRRHRHQPADALRPGQGVEPGVLAHRLAADAPRCAPGDEPHEPAAATSRAPTSLAGPADADTRPRSTPSSSTRPPGATPHHARAPRPP